MMRSNKPTPVDDTAFFTYKPLSNLPTPPPSYRERNSTPSSPRCDSVWGIDGQLPSHYRGPAIHLVNLIPSAASLADASISLTQGILTRANLPLETVALAVCILDSLNTRFARKWRLSCPLRSESSSVSSSKRHSLPQTTSAASKPCPATANGDGDQIQQDSLPQLHIDSVNPEIIILAALVIAVKFTEDPEQASRFYCSDWGHGLWSHGQLNATERCIMENLNYRIMPLCDEVLISDAMADMELAGTYPPSYLTYEPTPPESDNDEEGNNSFFPGHARSRTMEPSGTTFGLGWAM